MKSLKLTLTFLICLMTIIQIFPQGNSVPYKNPNLSIEERVNDLVSRMTLGEKISQMMNAADSINRLGIPDYNWWSEGLHGVAVSGVATVFPQAIGLAATWDDNLHFKVADAISTEFRAKFNDYQRKGDHGIFKGLTVWSPNVNIFRDPRWGRGQETYGEDPYLSSRMGIAFVKGMQGNDPKYFKTIATPKHYAVHSGPESERHHFNAVTDKYDFVETYTPAFKACVTEGGAYSVMGAYQKFLGTPCCANEFLLKDILRGQWNFKGYVVSDCSAIDDIYENHKFVNTPEEAAAIAVLAGCDLECGETYRSLKTSVQKNLLKESDIDTSVKRLFTARFKLGLFDPPAMVSYSQIPVSENNSPQHRELALKAAQESIVLLKNEGNFLPLKNDVKNIAVIGPNADVAEVLYGNYNGISNKPVTPLEGIKNHAPAGTKIIFEPGSNVADEFPILSAVPGDALSSEDGAGLKAEYYDGTKFQGTPFLTRIDKQVNFDFVITPPSPDKSERFSVRWTGWLIPPVTDTYFIGFTGDDGYRVYLDDKLIIENWSDHAPNLIKVKMDLVQGKKYKVMIEYYQGAGGAIAKFQWAKKDEKYTDKIDNVVSKADVVVYIGGIASSLEGEEMPVDIEGFKGGDRTSLDLPEVQDKILKRIKTSGKPIVLVLLSGSALSVNWADQNVNAILEAWYPGEEGGNAIADVLFGNYNPAGRLPVTFYKSVNDLPPFEDYNMTNRTYRYFKGEPLYPFGYGLSYTNFQYKNLRLEKNSIKKDEPTKVLIEVTNTGKLKGDEVVQLYVKAEKDSRAIKSLKGFNRISLEPNETKTVEFEITQDKLSRWIDNKGFSVEPDDYILMIGSSSADKDLNKIILKVE